jgi:hypothetical protein
MAAAPMRPQWTSRVAQLLAACVVLAAILAVALRLPIDLGEVDDVTLRIGLPSALGFVLAFAPEPATRVGRIARMLTVLGLSVGVFAGDWQPLLIACYPLVLMVSVLVDWILDRRESGKLDA